MKMIHLVALLAPLSTGACALESAHHGAEELALVKTQVPADKLAACIGQAAGTTPAPSGAGGYQVNLTTASSTRNVMVARTDIETVVTMVGDQSPLPAALGLLVVNCAVKLAPPSPDVSGPGAL